MRWQVLGLPRSASLGYEHIRAAASRAIHVTRRTGCQRIMTEEFVVTRWEYATVPLIVHALQQILNQWGADGWELVCVVDEVAYFKRPLPDGA